MKNPKTIYILIGAFCVFAIIAAIVAEVFNHKEKDTNNNNVVNNYNENQVQEKTQEEIKSQLNALLINNIIVNNYDTNNIVKIDNEKDIVYTAFDIQDQKENYEVDIHLPVVNIQNPVTIGFNYITQSIFANKAAEILNNKEQEKTIYSVNYAAFINENILSLIIKSNLKIGDNTQRIVVQTYNYNLATGQEMKFVDVLSEKNIIQSECKNKIKKTVERAKEEAQILVNAGYPVYNRNTDNEMYQLANISTYLVGPNKNLYIIFPYGNQHFTSEMDVILYE